MSLSSKLKTGLAVMLLLVGVQAWLHLKATGEARKVFEQDISSNTLAMDRLAGLVKTAHEMRRYEKEFFIYLGGEKRAKYVREWTDAYTSLKNQLGEMQANPAYRFSQDELDQLNQWNRALEYYASEFQRIVAASDPAMAAGGGVVMTTVSANEAIGPGKDGLKLFFSGAQRMVDSRKQLSRAAYASLSAEFEQANLVGLGTALAGLLIGLVMMLRLPRAIISPLISFTRLVDEMSRNLVADRIDDQTFAAEFKPLATALERLRVSQSGLVARLRKKQTGETEALQEAA